MNIKLLKYCAAGVATALIVGGMRALDVSKVENTPAAFWCILGGILVAMFARGLYILDIKNRRDDGADQDP
jgi:hypothetical protein